MHSAKAAYTMLVSSAVHSHWTVLDIQTIKDLPSISDLAHGIDFLWPLASCLSHLSAASWISVCVGSVGMTRFMRRAGRPSLPGRASTDTKVRYAEQQWCLAPVFTSSSSTLTPT